jgi:hypothetical protein
MRLIMMVAQMTNYAKSLVEYVNAFLPKADAERWLDKNIDPAWRMLICQPSIDDGDCEND